MKSFCLSPMKFFSLRLDRFAQFLFTSSVIVSLEFVSPDFRLTVGEDLLPLSVQKSPNLCVFSVQFLTSFDNKLPRSVVAFCHSFDNGLPRSIEQGRRGIVVIHVLEEPLLGEPLPSRGLCEGLDKSLREEVVFGLITCVGEGLVRRHHLLKVEYTVSYCLTSWKYKGSRNCLKLMRNERRKMVRGNAHFMHG